MNLVRDYIMKTLLTLSLILWSYTISQEAPIKFETNGSFAEFTPANLQKYITSKNLKHPQIVYAQALLETGVFSSTIFKENNNLFGMKYVGDFRYKYSRPTTATGSRYGHAVYQHWKRSVDDYQLWQKMFKRTPIETEEDYFKLLGARYAESKNYVKSLKYLIENDTSQWKR
jgi:flagellum-specific peptidoglycan hydrolase FlgJ